MSRTDLNTVRWLDAHSDQSAGLSVLPGCVALADTAGDADYRLVLADCKLEEEAEYYTSRLKIYKGTILVSDQSLPEVPSALISFYADNYVPRLAAIGVACGSDFLIYKNNKPFYKFTVPSLPIEALEEDIWKRLLNDFNLEHMDAMIDDLKTIPFYSLTPRSQALLTLEVAQRKDFVQKYVGIALTKSAPITCMTTLNRHTQEQNAVACPVLATESGQIYILDPQTYTVLQEASVSNVKTAPCALRATGVFNVEFRLVIACRDRFVCLLRRQWLEGKSLFQITSEIIDMVLIPGDNFICLATLDDTLQCYTKRGSKLWSAKPPQPITSLCLIPLHHLNTFLIAVGLRGGYIHLYQGRTPVDFIAVTDAPSAIAFGQLGQEEHVMIVVTLRGTLNFKILKRTADFRLSADPAAAPSIQSKPLPLPKRSKLFLEQSMRERQQAVEMHRNFQEDLVRLRLEAARAVLDINANRSQVGNEKEQLKLSAQVLGLGPYFTLILTLDNMSVDRPLIELEAVIHCKPQVYQLSRYVVEIPLIPPGLSYKIEVKIEELQPLLTSETNDTVNVSTTPQLMRVFIIKDGKIQPLLAATITMPPTDLFYYNYVQPNM